MTEKTNGKAVYEKVCSERHNALAKIAELCVDKLTLRIDGIERLMTERKEENERRLEALNQLRSEVTTDRSVYMRKDVYEKKIDSYDMWVSDVNRELTEIRTRYENRITLASWLSIVSIIVALASFLTMVFKVFK